MSVGDMSKFANQQSPKTTQSSLSLTI